MHIVEKILVDFPLFLTQLWIGSQVAKEKEHNFLKSLFCSLEIQKSIHSWFQIPRNSKKTCSAVFCVSSGVAWDYFLYAAVMGFCQAKVLQHSNFPVLILLTNMISCLKRVFVVPFMWIKCRFSLKTCWKVGFKICVLICAAHHPDIVVHSDSITSLLKNNVPNTVLRFKTAIIDCLLSFPLLFELWWCLRDETCSRTGSKENNAVQHYNQ